MLDIKFIRENSEKVKKASAVKGINIDIDRLLELDKKRVELKGEIDQLRAQRKMGAKPSAEEIEQIKELKKKLTVKEEMLKKIEYEYTQLMLLVPNIPSDSSPVGGEEANREVYQWGEPPKFDFTPKDHIELAKELDLIDLEAGVKVSGFRGYYLKNEAVLVQMGLILFALDKMRKKGFKLMIPPTLVREFALIGSGHFPACREEIYQICDAGKDEKGENLKDPLFLVGTSEPSILAYNVDRILNEDDLPIKYCGFSQCYRSEVGSYGKDTKGIYRIHEFMKVEQIVICKNDLEESMKWLETLREIAQEILEDLKLPYRVIQIATGDMGAGKYAMYDIETWMPSRNAYGETHSDSNLTDWQTRRLNIRYRNKEGKIVYPHSLNNTVIASPRILIPIFENYQQKDGSIKIPEVLIPYINLERIER